MIYGYTIQEIKTIGHGSIWWDEYYETEEYVHLDTKLFNSKAERDQKIKEEKSKYNTNILILPFETNKIH